MSNPINNKINTTPINFIIGMGRSGTTLLTTILNANSSVISASENNFILFGKNLSYKNKVSKEDFYSDFEDIFKIKHNHVVSSWKPDFDYIKRYQKSFDKQLDYQALCKLVYFSQNQNKKPELIDTIVDKNPIYSLFVGDLIELFPEAKFIILIRDYRDNIASRRKFTSGIVSKTIYNLAHTWQDYYVQIEKWRKKMPKKFIVLKYEDLVTNPKEKIGELCDFLCINYQDEMLHPEKELAKSNAVFNLNQLSEESKSRVVEMHGRLAKPIDTKKVNSWKDSFSQNELAILETICNKVGKKYGYERTLHISKFRKCLIWLQLALVWPLFYALNKIFHGFYYKTPLKLRKIILKSKN